MGQNIIWLLLLAIKLGLASIDYITNGNFDQPALANGSAWMTNPYGWNGSNIDVVNRQELGATYRQYIDMQQSTTLPGLLSQIVTLPSNGKYRYTFVIRCNDMKITDHVLKVSFNNISILNFTCQKIQILPFRFQVQGYIGFNQVSFREEGNQGVSGYYLDNVSLIGPLSVYRFECQKSIDFFKGQAMLQCQNLDNFTSLSIILQKINITFNNNLVINYSIASCQNQTFTILLLPQNSDLILNQINISVPVDVSNKLGQPQLLFLFLVEDLNLSLDQIRSMFDSQFIVKIYSISSIMMGKTKQLYAVFSTCIASYFLISIISFWNLALMFNTINISTVPLFTKVFLQKLTFIFYKLGSISDWIGFDIQTLNGLIDLNQISGRQSMKLERNNNIWFGSFGISSKFLVNNIQSNFVILWALIKICMLFLLRKIKYIPNCLRKKLPIVKIVWKLFLLQSISAQTFMVLSSITTILDPGYTDIKEKANFIIQSLVIMLSFSALYLHFLISVEIRLRNYYYKQKNNQQFGYNTNIIKLNLNLNLKRILLKFYLSELNSVLEFLPMIIVPFLIVFDALIVILPTFLLLSILRLLWLIKNKSFLSLSIVEKVFTFFNVVFFTLLCLIYLSLYIIQQTKYWPQSQMLGLEQFTRQYCDICGLLIILITLGGGTMEIVKHTILFMIYIVKILQKILKKLRTTKELKIKVAPVIDENKANIAEDKRINIKFVQFKKKVSKDNQKYYKNNNKNNSTNTKTNMKIKNGDREAQKNKNKRDIIFLSYS